MRVALLHGLQRLPVAHAADFLAPSDYAPDRLLPPPPPEGSPLAKAELEELDRIQSQRTPEDFARADHDFRTQNGTIFADAIGPNFVLSRLPATAKMLSDLQRQEDAAADVAKDYFHRTRPWIVDPSLKSCSKQDAPQSAYPSGHSTMAYAMAVVLAALVPAKATAILSRAADYAQNRLVCGMHRRSDIQAGQVLGTVVAELLLHDPGFRPELDAAKAELARAHLSRLSAPVPLYRSRGFPYNLGLGFCGRIGDEARNHACAARGAKRALKILALGWAPAWFAPPANIRPDMLDRAVAYNRAVAVSTNQVLLLNIVRASQRLPTYYTRLEGDASSMGITPSAGLTLPFTNPRSFENDINGGPTGAVTSTTSKAVGSLAAFASSDWDLQASESNILTLQDLDDQKYQNGMMTPVPVKNIAAFQGEGYQRDLLFMMFLASIQISTSLIDPIDAAATARCGEARGGGRGGRRRCLVRKTALRLHCQRALPTAI